MTIRETMFGSLEPLVYDSEKLLAEKAIFERNGRPHKHDTYETCLVLSGEGRIMNGKEEHQVKAKSVVSIPPEVYHWMIPDRGQIMEMIIIYHRSPCK